MAVPELVEQLDVVTWFVPGLILTLLASVLLARPVARRLGEGPATVWLLLFSAGAILSATVTPLAAPENPTTAAAFVCDMARIGLAPLHSLQTLNDTSLNIILFVPLGIALGLLRDTRTRTALTVVAVASPFAIEAFQLVASALARGCQSADVVDNLTGLAIGWLIGALVAATILSRR
jgi:VanZ family protein